jgi:hypothetical protein
MNTVDTLMRRAVFRFLAVMPIILELPIGVNNVHAERVGFQFSGVLQVAGTGNIALFGISVPRNSPVSGTFAYDTAAEGLELDANSEAYGETICGGYTLNINNGQIQLTASDYTVTVSNNSGSPESDFFGVDYNYDSTALPPVIPDKILVNGVPWTGSRAFIKTSLSWDSAAITNRELTNNLPLIPGSLATAFFGGSATPRFFSLTSISNIVPPAGDYNRDGKLDACDYMEWRKVFGETQPQFLYADGNTSNEVDAADYVVWRNDLVSAGLGVAVPEPSGLSMVAAGILSLIGSTVSWTNGERRR